MIELTPNSLDYAQNRRASIATELKRLRAIDRGLAWEYLDEVRGDFSYQIAKAERRASQQSIQFQSTQLIAQRELDHPESSFDSDSFLTSNEGRLHELYPLVRHLRGGVIGVGSDQVFDIFANSSLDYAWLIDYSRTNVLLMRALMEVGSWHYKSFGSAPTPEQFIGYFERPNREHLQRILEPNFSPLETDAVLSIRDGRTYNYFHGGLGASYATHMRRRVRLVNESGDPYGWYSTPGKLERTLEAYLDGRIKITAGNLSRPEAVCRVGQYCHQHGLSFSLLYLSNIECYAGDPRHSASANRRVRSIWQSLSTLPISDSAMIIRTSFCPSGEMLEEPYQDHPFQGSSSFNGSITLWHYNLESFSHHLQGLNRDPNYPAFGWADAVTSHLQKNLLPKGYISVLGI